MYPHILFVCSQARLRSYTGATVRSQMGRPAACAGTDADARIPLAEHHVRQADVIVCMEPHHARELRKRFPTALGDKPVFCPNIPDDFNYMQRGLVTHLREVMYIIDGGYAPARQTRRAGETRKQRLQRLADRAYERFLALRHFDERTAEHHRRRFANLYLQAPQPAISLYITP